ncbi:MAG: hypothetical protein ACLTE2_13345 [Eubacteriales bacterium]
MQKFIKQIQVMGKTHCNAAFIALGLIGIPDEELSSELWIRLLEKYCLK